MCYFRSEGPRILSSVLQTEFITSLDASISAEVRRIIANRAVDQCIEQILGTSAYFLSQGRSHPSSSPPDLGTASSSQGATSGILTLPSDEVESTQSNLTSQDKATGRDSNFISERLNIDTLPDLLPSEILLPEDLDLEALLNPHNFDERP